jgi:hypothetical protein
MLQQNMRFCRSINWLSFILGDERSHVPLPSSTLISRTVQHRLARTYDMWGPWFLGGTVLNTGCHGGAHCYVGLILQLAMEITGAQVDITPGSPGLHPVRGTRASVPKELRQTSWRNEMRSLMVNPSSTLGWRSSFLLKHVEVCICLHDSPSNKHVGKW